MYILTLFADIKIVLTVVLIIISIIIFPIFLSGNFNISQQKLKLFYKLKLFRIFTILKGYAEFINEGIIIHLTKRKAVIIPFENLFEVKKKVEPLKDYHLISCSFNAEIGNKENIFEPLSTAFTLNYIYNYIKWFLYHKKPYFKSNVKIEVFDSKDVFELYLNGTVVFNLLMVLISIIKILMGKLLNAFTKRIEQNK